MLMSEITVSKAIMGVPQRMDGIKIVFEELPDAKVFIDEQMRGAWFTARS